MARRASAGMLGCVAVMSIRAYKLSLAVLACVAVFFAWRWWVLLGHEVAAGFVDYECETTEDLCRNWHLIENRDASSLAMRLQFLMGYYESRSNMLAGSRLQRMVRRNYEQAVTNVLDTLRRETGEDLGSDPHAWIKKYEK